MSPHAIYCQHTYIHAWCECAGPHGNRSIICNDPAHQEEHSMTAPTKTVEELEAELEAAKAAVTPEEVAATALDEADDDPHVHGEDGYHIHPADDPDHVHDEDEEAEATCLTAFLVIVAPDGSAFATSELEKIGEAVPARQATIVDMRRACQEVVHDVNAMQISQQTVAIMQQSAQQMAEEKRNQQIAQKLVSKGVKLPRR